jgi:pimeloyl-ACP methyl ester carboxylesterase
MTLYLLHGALGAASQLDPLAARLRQRTRDYRVVEFVGHGKTPSAARPFTIAGFVEQLVEELERDGVESADFFGHSMGGYVALAFALAHPDRARSIVTLGTKFEWTPEVAARDAARLDPAAIRAKVPRFAEQLEARHRGAGGWERVLAQTAGLLTELGERPVLDASALERIEQPVRIAVGDRDATVSVEESARVSRALGKGELAVLPRTPHPFEQVNHALLFELVEPFRRAQPVNVPRAQAPATEFAELRKFSLHRGARRLGQIHRFPVDGDPNVSGFLILATDDEPLEGMMQTRIDALPGQPVFQHPVEVDDMGERSSRSRSSSSGRVRPRELSESEARGVPEDHRYAIRDEHGAELPTRMISVRETRMSQGSERAMFGSSAPPDALLHGSLWTVIAALDSVELSS